MMPPLFSTPWWQVERFLLHYFGWGSAHAYTRGTVTTPEASHPDRDVGSTDYVAAGVMMAPTYLKWMVRQPVSILPASRSSHSCCPSPPLAPPALLPLGPPALSIACLHDCMIACFGRALHACMIACLHDCMLACFGRALHACMIA